MDCALTCMLGSRQLKVVAAFPLHLFLIVFLLYEILLRVSTIVQHFVHIMCCNLKLTYHTLLWLSQHTRRAQKEKKNNKPHELATLLFSTVSLFITQTQA